MVHFLLEAHAELGGVPYHPANSKRGIVLAPAVRGVCVTCNQLIVVCLGPLNL